MYDNNVMYGIVFTAATHKMFQVDWQCWLRLRALLLLSVGWREDKDRITESCQLMWLTAK